MKNSTFALFNKTESKIILEGSGGDIYGQLKNPMQWLSKDGDELVVLNISKKPTTVKSTDEFIKKFEGMAL